MTEWLHEQQTRDFSRWERVLHAVTFASDWTIDVYLDPFGRDCEPGEREEFAAQITRIISEGITRPKVWESGLRSFAVNGAELARRAPIAGKYCSVVAGHKPGSGRILLQGGGAFSPNDAVEALRRVCGELLILSEDGAVAQICPSVGER